jgi:uncharacterized protein YjbI with pentapeptide repeats
MNEDNHNIKFEKLKNIGLVSKKFIDCEFISCDFVGMDLSRAIFKKCKFTDCNLTMSKINSSKFERVLFFGCKVGGLNFKKSSTPSLSISFEKSYVKQCNFSDLNLLGITFTDCEIEASEFHDTNLEKSNFTGSSFDDCIFNGCNLKNSNFTKTEGLVLNPALNKVYGMQVNKTGVAGLVKEFGIRVV